MECKICKFNYKNNISLSRHLSFGHNLTLLDYKIKHEGFKKPKCACGKNNKHKEGLKFGTTCGNLKCIKGKQKRERLKFIKENPEQTAWRTNTISYPENLFLNKLKELKLDEKFLIIRERCVFPFYIDFAFENEKVAIEIDGSQHNLIERKEKDKKKDKLLIKNGWRIYRVSASQIQRELDNVMEKILDFIGDSKTFEKCDIVLHTTLKQKEKLIIKEKLDRERKENNGLTNKNLANSLSQRKTKRPPYNQLIKEISESNYSAVGKKYGVSDNAIRKWVKNYKKYNC